MDIVHLLAPFAEVSTWVTILIILATESILSLDNGVVISTLVKNLPAKQQKQAMNIGFILAGVMRIGVLFAINQIMSNNWINLAGGLFLALLCVKHFWWHNKDNGGMPKDNAMKSGITLVIIQIAWTNLLFSIDNVVAVIGLTKDIAVIVFCVILAVITMRFVTGQINRLAKRYTFVDDAAHVVIGLIAGKLLLTYAGRVMGDESTLMHIMHSHIFEGGMMTATIMTFLVPIGIYEIKVANRNKVFARRIDYIAMSGKVTPADIWLIKDVTSKSVTESQLLSVIDAHSRLTPGTYPDDWKQLFVETVKKYIFYPTAKRKKVMFEDEFNLIKTYFCFDKRYDEAEVAALQAVLAEENAYILPEFKTWAEGVLAKA